MAAGGPRADADILVDDLAGESRGALLSHALTGAGTIGAAVLTLARR